MTREQQIAGDIHKILTGFNQQEGVYDGKHLRVAEYIVSRERLLLEKIGKPLYQWQSTQQKLVNCQCYICQALAIIEKEGVE